MIVGCSCRRLAGGSPFRIPGPTLLSFIYYLPTNRDERRDADLDLPTNSKQRRDADAEQSKRENTEAGATC
jgi:hypothetical protein